MLFEHSLSWQLLRQLKLYKGYEILTQKSKQ